MKEAIQDTMTAILKQEFPCKFCSGLADRLVHYSKLYHGDVDPTIENPVLCCKDCEQEARTQANCSRGGIEGAQTLTFERIVKMPDTLIGMCLLNKRGRTVNHLAYPQWRKKIWRIHYCFQPKKGEGNEI